jgi:cell shape-determining protein MreC
MWLTATGVFALSLAVTVADRTDTLKAIRPAIHDALSPGRTVLLAISNGSTPAGSSGPNRSQDSSNRDKEPSEESRRRDQLLRKLMIENAQLRRDLRREKASTHLMQTIEPLSSLVQFDLIPATIVSASGMSTSLKDLIVDAGKAAGITRSELVVDGSGAVLDAGSDKTVSAGDRVLTGTIVVGRIEKASRWVSLVQPVTASGFRAQVMLLRQTAEGLHPGSTGLLEGTGETECLLTGIPHTEAVAIGDEVVSADINGVQGPQLYFGRVTKADFLAGGQWDIRVTPAVSLSELQSVGILRLRLQETKP